ncbi:DUF6491 family protein [Lysobacter sp. FW306-1B-D06B]|uniref:DUF6491 family protein n=1 Tax=Lysobacter sp. FW306-1B-D06B TaxID=3140250 RepID=UPI00313FF8A1
MCARTSDAIARLLACTWMILLCACAHTPTDPRERLSRYRAQAGLPVADFPYVRNMRWEALGDQALAVWPRRETGFLIELPSPCHGLDEARAIRIGHGDGRVRSRIDAIRVLSLPGSPPMQRPPCPIMLISPLPTPGLALPDELRTVEDEAQ